MWSAPGAKLVAKKRQSPDTPDVEPVDREQLASAIGDRVAARMRALGWVLDDGRLDVRALARAARVEWQTAQTWTQGTRVPTMKSATKMAGALGISVQELLGVSAGAEPTNGAWRTFLDTPEGRSMTPEERRAVGRFLPPDGRSPSVLMYQFALVAARACGPL
jgi:transcriptional regulator with XRE-family HTH domain